MQGGVLGRRRRRFARVASPPRRFGLPFITVLSFRYRPKRRAHRGPAPHGRRQLSRQRSPVTVQHHCMKHVRLPSPPMTRTYPSRIVAAANRALGQLGFRKFDDYYVALELGPEATAFVQVTASRASFPRSGLDFTLSASFGLRVHELHKLLSALAGWGDSPNFIGIAHRLVTSNTDHRPKTWPVSAESLAHDLGAFKTDVETFALPALREISSPKACCRCMLELGSAESRFSWQAHWWTPVALVTLGNTAAAVAFAENELNSLHASAAEPTSYAQGYQVFVNALRALQQNA